MRREVTSVFTGVLRYASAPNLIRKDSFAIEHHRAQDAEEKRSPVTLQEDRKRRGRPRVDTQWTLCALAHNGDRS